MYHYYGTGGIGGSLTLNLVDAVERKMKGQGTLLIISVISW